MVKMCNCPPKSNYFTFVLQPPLFELLDGCNGCRLVWGWSGAGLGLVWGWVGGAGAGAGAGGAGAGGSGSAGKAS